MDDLASGRFRRILGDTREKPAETTCVLLTSGKMYYDLVEAREKQERRDVAIVRVEQFYPLRDEVVVAGTSRLPGRDAGPLGAGRAGQHGRLALLEESLLPPTAGPLSVFGRGPVGIGQPSDRFVGRPSPRTRRIDRASIQTTSEYV